MKLLQEHDSISFVNWPSSGSGASDRERLIRTIAELEAEAKQLREEVVRISTFERERIGHELHDDFTQNLAGIACLSRQLQGRLRKKDPALARLAADITLELTDTLERVRLVSHELVPYELEHLELVDCLRKFIRKTRARTGRKIAGRLDPSLQFKEVTVRLHLYRITQEAIRNAILHGKAKNITVELKKTATDKVRLAISDNGVGLQRDLPSSDGLGIRLMQYRCHQIGASLALDNSSDGGAVIEVLLPIRSQHNQYNKEQEL